MTPPPDPPRELAALCSRIGARDEGAGAVVAACSRATLRRWLIALAAAAPRCQLAVFHGDLSSVIEGSAVQVAAELLALPHSQQGAAGPRLGLIRSLRRRRLDFALTLADEDRAPERWAQAMALASRARSCWAWVSDSAAFRRIGPGWVARTMGERLRQQAWDLAASLPGLGAALTAGEARLARAWAQRRRRHEPPARLGELRVLLVASSPGASTRYRVQHKQEQLALLGIHASVRRAREYRAAPRLAGRDAAHHDLAIVHRIDEPGPASALLSALAAAGRPIVYDIDDLLFDPGVIEYVPAPSRKSIAGQVRLLARCTHAFAATSELAARLAPAGRPTWVVRNSLSEEWLALCREARAARGSDGSIRLGYLSGSATHDRDLAAIAPALVEAMARHPRLHLVLVGPVAVPAGLAALSGRVVRLPYVPWRDLPGLMAEHVDANLAPLESASPFCRAKSAVKYLEAAALGVPTIASPIPAFREVIRPGENGFLADTTEDWLAMLESLARDPGLAARVGGRARVGVEASFGPRQGAEELAAALSAVLDIPC